MTESVNTTTGEIVNIGARMDDDVLASIATFDDVAALFAAENVKPDKIEDYGNGFEILADKGQLVGKPFMVIAWNFQEGDYGLFSTMFLITEDNRKYIVNDGSAKSGITKDLQEVTRRRVEAGRDDAQKGLMVRKGLKVSDYTYYDKDGKGTPARTYYLK